MRRLLAMIPLAAALAAGCAAQADRDVLYQLSTIPALMEGLYDGQTTLAELLRHGDLGHGTFDALDGEMVIVDGRVYQVGGDGRVRRPALDTKTPLAAVTFFEPDHVFLVDAAVDLVQLEYLMDRMAQDAAALAIPDAAAARRGLGAPLTRNMPLAVRISGTFKYVKTRSVPRQTRPYPRLVDVTARQAVFEFRDVRGTIVGFRFPDYIKGVNLPGWHLHFITEDEAGGGHVLDVQVGKVRVAIDETPVLQIVLPQTHEYRLLNLARDTEADARRIAR
ncbi:MAG: acetolactate decarboxylase [Planctomycetota bacterium]|nr:acetolactate decarboxylase [Planctomycetota bacterium]